jgi:hypothetical protein
MRHLHQQVQLGEDCWMISLSQHIRGERDIVFCGHGLIMNHNPWKRRGYPRNVSTLLFVGIYHSSHGPSRLCIAQQLSGTGRGESPGTARTGDGHADENGMAYIHADTIDDFLRMDSSAPRPPDFQMS